MSHPSHDVPYRPRLDRREAIKWMMSATAGAVIMQGRMFGADAPNSGAPLAAHGYGMDPDMLKTYKPGDLWPLTFDETQRKAARALCDVIVPKDEHGPGALAVGVPEFIDEWVSAPYPDHARDRTAILDGLAWIDAEAKRRFNVDFAGATDEQKRAICDDICYAAKAAPEHRKAAQFFARFRDLTAGGYYTTPEGFKDIGYVGNVPSATFEGPPESVIRKLGLEDVAGYNGLADASLQ